MSNEVQAIPCFNPLPLPKQGEMSCGQLRPRGSVPWFQSAPLTEARGDRLQQHNYCERDNCFNPLPLPKQGEMCPSTHGQTPRTSFQSAPLTEARGDVHPAGERSRRSHRSRFNPLPLPKQGEMEQAVQPRPVYARPCFNPLPLPKQGEIWTANGYPNAGRNVSIRSPYRSKGRWALAPRKQVSAVSIRSPYRSKGRYATVPAVDVTTTGSFNPLPLPKQGEIFALALPLPSRSYSVSIRSPYRSKGRWVASPVQAGDLSSFNPLPLPKQGEIRIPSSHASDRDGFNPLPLPKQGEMRIETAGGPTAHRSMFQSAPLTEARGDVRIESGLDPPLRPLVSIRSPYRSKGRCRWSCRLIQVAWVSIRSPYRSKGRFRIRDTKIPDPDGSVFQSAPLTEARGDVSRFLTWKVTDSSVSIRSPYRSKGRFETSQSDAQDETARSVSIRSPYRSKGRSEA